MESGPLFYLKPRFLPDREAQREWGSRGSNLLKLIRRGFRVPPLAAFGISQIQGWLSSLPEWTGALQAWRDWDDPEPALLRLRTAILETPMPEHWAKSTETLIRLLCGGTKWPLVLRLSFQSYKARTPIRLGHEKVEKPEAPALWNAFLKIVASCFELENARKILLHGFDPRELRFGIVVQPWIDGDLSGTWVSGIPETGLSLGADGERPFYKDLQSRGKLAERSFKQPVNLQWIWDGDELWFVDVRSANVPNHERDELPVKQLLVDLDGTLLGARELPLRYNFIKLFMREIKVHGGWFKAFRALKSVGDELKNPSPDLQEMTNDERVIRRFAQVLGKPIADARELLASSVRTLFPKLEPHFFPVPGAREFLDWARARYPMLLATNPVWEESIIGLRLKWAGIPREWFSSVTHSSRMRACKPEAQYYSDLLEQEKLDAHDCLLVGDDRKNDLPATQVGIRTFILSPRDEFRLMPSHRNDTAAWKGSYPRLQALLRAVGTQ